MTPRPKVTVADPSECVRVARDRYFLANGFGTGDYRRTKFVVPLGPVALTFPNPGVLFLHDLHHVVTGYGTDFVGEAEISAFELRAGVPTPLVFVLCVGSLLLASFVAPRRVARALGAARGARSLYRAEIPYATALEMTVDELRRRLGVPPGGLVPFGLRMGP